MYLDRLEPRLVCGLGIGEGWFGMRVFILPIGFEVTPSKYCRYRKSKERCHSSAVDCRPYNSIYSSFILLTA